MSQSGSSFTSTPGSPGLLSTPLRHEVRSPGITTRISALIRGRSREKKSDTKDMLRKMQDFSPCSNNSNSSNKVKRRFVDPRYKGIGLLPKVDLNPSPLPKLTSVRRRNSTPLKIISANQEVSFNQEEKHKRVSLICYMYFNT